MREDIASLTLSLRRYAHALLGRAPRAGARTGAGRIGADLDADDLAHEALLGFWRAGLVRFHHDPPSDHAVSHRPDGALRIALLRRLTSLARAASLQSGDLTDGGELEPQRAHFAWAPEARALPRLALESRALLALAALERLNYDEIGQVLDMSAGQVLAKLARARAQLANAISGESRPYLHAACLTASWRIPEADLHLFADDLLEAPRRAEIEALLENDPECARRIEEWRRGAERLRGAFSSLLREPVPVTLNFTPVSVRPRPARRASLTGLAWLKGLAVRLGGSPALRAH